MIDFVLFGFNTPQAVPIRVFMSQWIEAANNEVMYSQQKH